MSQVGTWHSRRESLFGCLVVLTGAMSNLSAHAAAGAPLPRCGAGTESFYLARYLKAGADNSSTPPTIALDQVTLPASQGGVATVSNIWTGQSAPTPINAGSNVSVDAGATVAMGMNPQNGYIYAVRATQGDPDYDRATWSSYTGHIQILKYGSMGVDNLGPIQGLPNTYWAQLGPNYNGAAFNPKTGELLIANWQTAGSTSALIRVSVASPVPTYVGVINLSTPIVAQSGDFAIDATGTYAYGIATGARGACKTSYRIDLASGQLTPLMTGVGESIFGLVWAPYGGAARLQSGQLAFVGGFSTASPGVRLMTIPSGTVSSPNFTTTDSAQGLDATECLPQLPVVTLACTPTALVDSPSNQAVCTITSDTAAPSGGLSVALTLPAASGRYSTDCTDPITIAAASTTATCTIVATPNTVAGDGSVNAIMSLTTPSATSPYTLGTPASATITVNDDDRAGAVSAVPTLSSWALSLLGLVLAGSAGFNRRRP